MQDSNVSPDPAQLWEQTRSQIQRIREQTARVIVGQDQVVELMLTALLCKGHCLIVGVPGLAKTLLVSTLGKILGLKFHRIQFTPDLMPTDIVGSEILQTTEEGGRRFEFAAGPIFANLILADEINRTPPKTQAALLEAMQEQAGHGRREDAPTRGAVPRFRHAEPDRARRHLSPARGAARPLLLRAADRLSKHGRRTRRSSIAPREQNSRRRKPFSTVRACFSSRAPSIRCRFRIT